MEKQTNKQTAIQIHRLILVPDSLPGRYTQTNPANIKIRSEFSKLIQILEAFEVDLRTFSLPAALAHLRTSCMQSGLGDRGLKPRYHTQQSTQVTHWKPHRPKSLTGVGKAQPERRFQGGKAFHLQRCGATTGRDSSCVPDRAAARPEARPPWESPRVGPHSSAG